MDSIEVKQPVALVGLMGAGKTSIGKRLAKKLGRRFIDLDQYIEKKQDCLVKDIFTHLGENAFRAMERQAVSDLMDETDIVLATGGGAFIQGDIRDILLEKYLVVWLKADVNVLAKRVGSGRSRPLLAECSPLVKLESLAKERYPVYEQAHIIVRSDKGHFNDIIADIVGQVEKS